MNDRGTEPDRSLDDAVQRWLDTAVSGIRFKPDRAAVRRELADHLEDKCASLEKSFHISWENVEKMALERMGDPEELGKELAKIHKPWLGWLWIASRWVLGLLTVGVVLAILFMGDHYASTMGDPVFSLPSTYGQIPPQALAPEQEKLGDYTFRIREAVWLDYPDSDPTQTDRISVTFRVSTPCFWARIAPAAVESALTLRTQSGAQVPMDRATLATEPETGASVYWDGLQETERGFFHREFTAWAQTSYTEGDWVWLDFRFEQGDFTLAAQLTRQEVTP